MSGVQEVTVDTLLTAASPSTTLVKLVGSSDVAVTLPDASTAVGQSFTITRDSSSGRSWRWTNTGITTTLNASSNLQGALSPDSNHYFVPANQAAGAALYKYNTTTWLQEASSTLPSGNVANDMLVSSDGSQLFVLVTDIINVYLLAYSTSSLSLLHTVTIRPCPESS